MLPNDVHHAFLAVPHPIRGTAYHPAGRFLVHRGQLHTLEDYHGLLADLPQGPVNELTLMHLQNPKVGLHTASRASLLAGHHPELLPEAEMQPLPKPAATPAAAVQAARIPQLPPVWHYHRSGHDRPHVLESQGNQFLLDGNPLKDDEVATILDNVRTRRAKIRYVKPGTQEAVMKAELAIKSLKKAEEGQDPQDALAHLDQIHAGSDDKTREAIATLRRHIYEDPMTPGLGNKFAYTQFAKKNVPGVWASLDWNDLRHANNTYGHDVGDQLIRAYGKAIRESVNPQEAKAFRFGGDEFAFHFPDPETAYRTMRSLRDNIDQFPPVNGEYKPSFSVGFGHNFKSADEALYAAKARKETPAGERVWPAGKVPHLAHSNIPGAEGPVPLEPHQLQVHPPKLDEVEPPVAPPAPAHKVA